MDYEIRYFSSPDGASVAGARGGHGPPLVISPSFGSTIETDWAIYAAAFPHHELITWDRRGFGLSERGLPGEDAEPYLRDAQAAIDGFGLETFGLVGTLMGTVEATWLAANNPERATRLVLRVPSTGMANWAAIPGVAAGLAALEHDWEYFTESFAQFALGWGEPGAHEMSAKFRAITTRDELRAMFNAFIGLDLLPLYPRIRATVLIEHNPAYFFPQSMSRRVAGMIDDCQLSIYAGPRGEFMKDFSLARRFLAGPDGEETIGRQGRRTTRRDGEERRLSAVLIADIASYTQLVEKDTDGTIAAWKSAREDVIEPLISQHVGHLVKLTGDGFLAEFSSVLEAVTCAMSIQEALHENSLEFRMGIHLGDIVADGEDIYGEGVNIAARIEGLAEPGGICISGAVHEQIRNRIDGGFEDLGVHELKHVSAPVHIYRVVPGPESVG